MAWLEVWRDAKGASSYWIVDVRDGQKFALPGGRTQQEAERALEQYTIRRDLEKEGYGDWIQGILDAINKPKRKPYEKGRNN